MPTTNFLPAYISDADQAAYFSAHPGWAHAWAHPDVLERRKEIVPELLDFEKEGSLTICSDPTEDVRGAADIAERLMIAQLLPEKMLFWPSIMRTVLCSG